jgi:hypothetical protein
MGSNMLGNVLGRIRSETVLLSLIIVLSITSSVILMSDAMIGLATERYGLSLTVLRALELTFASTWFLLSMNITRQSNRLRKTLHRLYSQSTLSGVEEEQKKGEIAKLVRDLIVFYRDNYFKFAVMTILATGVSFSIILTVTYLLLSGSMTIWVAAFRWGVNSSMLLAVSTVYAVIHRSWGEKLSKIKDAEKRLLGILGGPIEA